MSGSAGADERDVEVVVVGAGIAGLAAALAARARGARRVTVVESEDVVGGSARATDGAIVAAGTRRQRALGVVDRPAALAHDHLQRNGGDLDVALVRLLADASAPTIDWLGDLGVAFHDELGIGDDLVARLHVPIGGAQSIVDVLHGRCRDAGVEVSLGRRIDRLVVHDDAVAGVAGSDDRSGGTEVLAGAVVLAAGGFGNDAGFVAAHFPSVAATGEAWYVGAPGSRGDALRLGAQVQAQTTGHDIGLRHLHAGGDLVVEPELPGWVVLVDGDGRRVCDETSTAATIDQVVRRHGDRVWAICSTAQLVASDGMVRSRRPLPGAVPRRTARWTMDGVEAMVRAGRAVRGVTVADLALALDIDAAVLGGTIDRYRADADARDDRQFAKDPTFLEPIGTGPYVAVELRPSAVCVTAHGLRIDQDAQVLDAASRPIGGLFAAGECVGGVLGGHIGRGVPLTAALVFGRIAGESAAARSLRRRRQS